MIKVRFFLYPYFPINFACSNVSPLCQLKMTVTLMEPLPTQLLILVQVLVVQMLTMLLTGMIFAVVLEKLVLRFGLTSQTA